MSHGGGNLVENILLLYYSANQLFLDSWKQIWKVSFHTQTNAFTLQMEKLKCLSVHVAIQS